MVSGSGTGELGMEERDHAEDVGGEAERRPAEHIEVGAHLSIPQDRGGERGLADATHSDGGRRRLAQAPASVGSYGRC